MVVLDALHKYKPRKPDYETATKNVLIKAKNFYDGREMNINAFFKKIFSFSSENFPEHMMKMIAMMNFTLQGS